MPKAERTPWGGVGMTVGYSLKTLYYIHDPMCSWCWAFHPVWQQVLENLTRDISVEYLVGGLAPDSDAPMDESTQVMIQKHWHTITKKVPTTKFNFDFWVNNTPRRSTYPACRAVLAAKSLGKEREMILAIQQAYYLNALNPSDDAVLINCAASIGLDQQTFSELLNAKSTQTTLQQHIQQAQSIGVFSFPSLVLENNGQYQPVRIDYNSSDNILKQLVAV